MSADLPIRLLVLKEFERRCQAIHGSGFHTAAGHAVHLGLLPGMGPDDPDEAIAIIPGEEDPRWNAKQVLVLWPIEIHALAKATVRKPWEAVERVIADIKRAVELEDRTFGGLLRRDSIERGAVRAAEREPGSTTVGALVPYTVRILEVWGNPT